MEMPHIWLWVLLVVMYSCSSVSTFQNFLPAPPLFLMSKFKFVPSNDRSSTGKDEWNELLNLQYKAGATCSRLKMTL